VWIREGERVNKPFPPREMRYGLQSTLDAGNEICTMNFVHFYYKIYTVLGFIATDVIWHSTVHHSFVMYPESTVHEIGGRNGRQEKVICKISE